MAKSSGLPAGVYGGGAVVFHPEVYAQHYLQDLAHQRAQQDATFKYFGELGSRLTPTGMVDEDVHELINKKNQWQQFNIQNKNRLSDTRYDKGQAYMQSMQKYNEMQDLIQRSKAKTDVANKYIKPLVSDQKKYALLSDQSKEAIHRAGRPVTDPEYVPLKPEDITFKDKPFDTSDVSKLQGVLLRYKGDLVPGKPIQDQKTGTQVVTSTRQFGNNDLTGMYQTGNMLYNSNDGFRHQVDNTMNPLNPEFDEKNTTFKQHYGRDINSPQDMSAAYILSYNPNPQTVTSKPTKIPSNPQQLSDIAEARQKDVALYKHNLKETDKVAKTTEESTKIRDFTDKLFNQAKGNKMIDTDKAGNKSTSYEANVSESILKQFSHKDPNDGHIITPSAIRFSEDGETVTPIFRKGEKSGTGQIAVERSIERPMSREEFDNTVGKHLFGVKEVNKQAKTATTNIKPKKERPPLDAFIK